MSEIFAYLGFSVALLTVATALYGGWVLWASQQCEQELKADPACQAYIDRQQVQCNGSSL